MPLYNDVIASVGGDHYVIEPAPIKAPLAEHAPASTTTTTTTTTNERGFEGMAAYKRYTRSSHEMLLYKADQSGSTASNGGGGGGGGGSGDSHGSKSADGGGGDGGDHHDDVIPDVDTDHVHSPAFCHGATTPPQDTDSDAAKSRKHRDRQQRAQQQEQEQEQDQEQERAGQATQQDQQDQDRDRRDGSAGGNAGIPLDTCMATVVSDSAFYLSNGGNTAGTVALMMQYIEFADQRLRATPILGTRYGVAIDKVLIYEDPATDPYVCMHPCIILREI